MLSIIIPVYNGELYIESCIDNILRQNYNSFELVIVNDGSIDKTEEICEVIKTKDQRIKVINIKNSGVSEARNIGVKNSIGNYVAFVDVDDKIDENMYLDMMSHIEKNEIDLVMCSYKSIFNDREENEIFPWEDGILDIEKINNDFIPRLISKITEDGKYQQNIMGSACRCIFKKEILEKNNLSFEKKLKISEDLLFLLQYIVRCKKIYTTNSIYYFYNRKTDAQLSTTQRYIPELEENLNFVNLEIRKIIKDRNIKVDKAMLWREVTNTYAMVINICRKSYKKNIFSKSKEIKRLLDKNDFNRKINELGEENLFDLRKQIVNLLRRKLQLVVVLYYMK